MWIVRATGLLEDPFTVKNQKGLHKSVGLLNQNGLRVRYVYKIIITDGKRKLKQDLWGQREGAHAAP
jgi:hypothetical protein